MRKSITVKNIKHIKELEFEIPSSPGVYVLTGCNGSGKTTLMTCLLRIGQSNAFQYYFKTGNEEIDSYEGEIIYQVGNDQVSYHYAGSRWPPTPRKNSELFNKFGFPEVRFLPATGNRLYIHDQSIDSIEFKNVEANLKTDMNDILETEKFKNLKYVQTGSVRGPGGGSQRWKRAYVIKKASASYYSEKNFSLGEILILNTLLLIQDVQDGSMLVIDELEMALHPKVQIKLLDYLEKKSKERNLTIILSTHSSSIIKRANRIIYLENHGDGTIEAKRNCYPAYILKEVAIEEDIQPDYIFMVEDDMAEMLLKEIIQLYHQIESDRSIPVYKVIPIGGYSQVLDFAQKTSCYLFNSKIGQYIFLDADVIQTKDDLVKKSNNRDTAEQQLFELFKSLESRTYYLPITPELGLWEWLNNCPTINARLYNHYNVTINIKDLIYETDQHFSNSKETDSGEIRKKAKRRLKYLVNLLEKRTNEDSKRINQYLFGQFLKDYYANNQHKEDLKATLGRIFNKRGNITD